MKQRRTPASTARPGGSTETSLGRLARHCLEAAPAAALIVTPLFFNPRTDRVFEPDKLSWIIVLAVMAIVGLIVFVAERRAEHRRPSVMRTAPIIAAAALLATLALSTVFSHAPTISLWGTYRRAHGFWSMLAIVTLAVGIAVVSRRRGARQTLVRAMQLPTLPVATYAILQRFGIDTIRWNQFGEGADVRAFASLGNAIFLGAWLALVLPVAAAGLITALDERAAGRGGGTRRAVGHGLILVLGVAALLATGSRGPLLGLLAGFGALALWHAAASGRRGQVAAVVGAAAAAPLLLIGLARAGVPGMERFAALFDFGSRTAQERWLAWEALWDLAVAEPGRVLFGHGPETVTLVLAPHAAEALTRLTPEQVFDRSHSLFWEWWVAAGLVGVAAFAAVIGASFAAGYRSVGWFHGRRDAFTLAGAALAPVAAVAVITGLAGIPAAFPPLAAPALALGLVTWGAWRALSLARVHGREQRTPRLLLTLALLALLAAHLVEGALGLPSAAADLSAWTAIGILAALGAWTKTPSLEATSKPPQAAAGPSPADIGGKARTKRRARGKSAEPRHVRDDVDPVADGFLDGLAPAATVFAPLLLPFGFSALGDDGKWLLLLLPLAAWLAADLLAPGERGFVGPAGWIARATPTVALLILMLPLGGVVGGPSAAFGLMIGGSMAAFLVRRLLVRSGGASTTERTSPVRWVAYGALAIGAVMTAWRVGLAPVFADSQLRSGLEAAARDDDEAMAMAFRRAASIWPEEPSYANYIAALERNRVIAEEATGPERDAAFRNALALLEVADERWPVASSARRMATLHRDRGDVAPDATSRLVAWEEAARWLAIAFERDPHAVENRIEAGLLAERRGMLATAIDHYSRAADLSPGNDAAWGGLARAHLGTGDAQAAVAAIDAALAYGTEERLVAALSALLPAPWSPQVGPPLDPAIREGALVLARARTATPETARQLLDQMVDAPPGHPIHEAVRRWLDEAATPPDD